MMTIRQGILLRPSYDAFKVSALKLYYTYVLVFNVSEFNSVRGNSSSLSFQ